MSKICVLGAGTWGTALAKTLANAKNDVVIWSPLKSDIEYLTKNRTHKNIPGLIIPDNIKLTTNMERACCDMDILLIVVPSIYMRQTVSLMAQYVKNNQIILSATKGIEDKTSFVMTEIIKDELSKLNKTNTLAAISGPTHAEEVAKDIPTMAVCACENIEIANYIKNIFKDTCIRLSTSDDVVGVELCGAIKNIIALAAGISDGLGYGDNTKAAVITKGMKEIKQIGLAMNCKSETFNELAGIGDLIVTATSKHSRNCKAGYLFGKGHSLETVLKEVGMVVEGLNALPAVMGLIKKYNLQLPIIQGVNSIVNLGMNPKEAAEKIIKI